MVGRPDQPGVRPDCGHRRNAGWMEDGHRTSRRQDVLHRHAGPGPTRGASAGRRRHDHTKSLPT